MYVLTNSKRFAATNQKKAISTYVSWILLTLVILPWNGMVLDLIYYFYQLPSCHGQEKQDNAFKLVGMHDISKQKRP